MPLAIAALVIGVTTGCLTIPFGIIALVNANHVEPQWARGERAGAEASARRARTFSIVTFWVAGVSFVLSFILTAVFLAHPLPTGP
jgi:Interferon-induced transmembrane protein